MTCKKRFGPISWNLLHQWPSPLPCLWPLCQSDDRHSEERITTKTVTLKGCADRSYRLWCCGCDSVNTGTTFGYRILSNRLFHELPPFHRKSERQRNENHFSLVRAHVIPVRCPYSNEKWRRWVPFSWLSSPMNCTKLWLLTKVRKPQIISTKWSFCNSQFNC